MNNRRLIRFFVITTAVFIIFLSFFLPANAQQYDTLDKLEGYHRYNLYTYFLHINEHKPSEIEKIGRWVKQNGDETEKKIYESFLEMPKYDSLPNSEEKKIEALAKYIDWGKKNNNHYFLAGYYYYISDLYRKTGQYNKSVENSLYSLDELKKDPSGMYFEQGWMLYIIGLDFYRYKDYEKAQELSISAFRFHDKPTNPNSEWFVKGCSNLAAVACLKNGNFTLAKNWVDSTLYYSGIQKDTTWIGIATGNLGNIQYLQKKYAAAIPYFERAIPLCRKSNITWDNVAAFGASLADCYLHTGNKAAVPALLKEVEEANKKHYEYIPVNFLEYFKVAAAYYREEGNAAITLRLTDSINLYQKKIDDEFSVLKKTQAEARLAYRNKELENLVLKEAEKKDRLLRYGLITALLMLIVISILFVKRQKLRHQLKKEKLEKEMLIAEEELTLALTEIKDFTYHILEKNKLIESYADEIEKLKKKNATITDEQLVSLQALRNATVLTDAEWVSFKTLFEKVHPGYLQRLKSNAANLTPAETRYLVFTKLDITSKEMASMLGVGSEAIRNIRFRLKKKLNLEDSREIEEWLKEL